VRVIRVIEVLSLKCFVIHKSYSQHDIYASIILLKLRNFEILITR